MIAHSLLVTTHRDNLDGRKVRNSSGKIPGKKCGGSYISASFKCRKNRGKGGKLNQAGKASSQELAAKVRAARGLKPLGSSKKAKREAAKQLPELWGSDKQISWAEDLRNEAITTKGAYVKAVEDRITRKIKRFKSSGDYESKGSAWVDKRRATLEQTLTDFDLILEQDEAAWWIKKRGAFDDEMGWGSRVNDIAEYIRWEIQRENARPKG